MWKFYTSQKKGKSELDYFAISKKCGTIEFSDHYSTYCDILCSYKTIIGLLNKSSFGLTDHDNVIMKTEEQDFLCKKVC